MSFGLLARLFMAKQGLKLLGKGAGAAFSKPGLLTAGAVGADVLANDARVTSTVFNKVGSAAVEAGDAGVDLALEKGLERLGLDEGTIELLQENSGKLLAGVGVGGLLTLMTGNMGKMIMWGALAVAAYVGYKHFTKNEFNAAANPDGPEAAMKARIAMDGVPGTNGPGVLDLPTPEPS